MKKVEVKPGKKSDRSVETLEQITKEWIKQQRSKFGNTNSTFPKRRISNKFSVYSDLRLFRNAMCKKRRLDDILYIFRLYIPNIAALLKNIWSNFVRSIEVMLRIERYESKAGKKS
jgi:hypothetical protein